MTGSKVLSGSRKGFCSSSAPLTRTFSVSEETLFWRKRRAKVKAVHCRNTAFNGGVVIRDRRIIANVLSDHPEIWQVLRPKPCRYPPRNKLALVDSYLPFWALKTKRAWLNRHRRNVFMMEQKRLPVFSGMEEHPTQAAEVLWPYCTFFRRVCGCKPVKDWGEGSLEDEVDRWERYFVSARTWSRLTLDDGEVKLGKGSRISVNLELGIMNRWNSAVEF